MSYTDEQKREALEAYETEGTSAAARATGIPGSTIRTWAKNEGRTSPYDPEKMRDAHEARDLRMAARRDELRELLLEKALLIAGSIDLEHAGRDLQPRTVALGILIDKLRLESGEATNRVEHISEPDSPIETVVDELASRRQPKRDPEARGSIASATG